MRCTDFKSAEELERHINFYFSYIDEMNKYERQSAFDEPEKGNSSKKDKFKPISEQATISGLVHYLGFASREDFDSYTLNGIFAETVKRGQLRIEEIYERKLLQASPAGAIFALKSIGWKDKHEIQPIKNEIVKALRVEFFQNGSYPVGSETDVII